MKYRVIFIVFNLKGGGAERVTITLANTLAERGHKVTMFLFYDENDYPKTLNEKIKIVTVLPKNYKFRNGICKVIRMLLNEAKEHDIVVGSLEGWTTLFSWVAARIRNKICIAWLHTDLIKYSDIRWNYFFRFVFTFPYNYIDKTVCVSDGVKSSLLGLLNKNICTRVIYNPLFISQYSEKNASSLIPIVLGVGRLENKTKGFDFLIKAHSKLINDGLLHRLVIVGEGDDRKLLEELVRKEGVQNTVSLPGFVRNISEFYNNADIFVLSSRFEGLGMVILEAMSYGIPVVATDCKSGPREILCGNEYGELVAPNSVDALAAGIKKLLEDENLRKSLSKKGLERVKDFEPDFIAQKWEQVFNETCR